MELQVIPEARGQELDVLLVHAPYPGTLMFEAHPTSMLYAIAPFMAAQGPWTVGYMDAGASSEGFYEELKAQLPGAKVLCISTSTAAIRETARIAKEARRLRGEELLIVAGGPHEDDIDEKIAVRLREVDISIAGEAEFLLGDVLSSFLTAGRRPRDFCCENLEELATHARGVGVVSSKWWGAPESRSFGSGPVPLAEQPPRPIIDRAVRFEVFETESTLPVMISRGCSYGRCTFCAEAGGGGQETLEEFSWLEAVLRRHPDAAVYFQDSIFPKTAAVRDRLLPMLKIAGREWGCQVYLQMLSKAFVDELAAHGCSYVYTGLESADPAILKAVGKGGLSRELARQKLGWIRDAGMRVGLSLMFGTFGSDGRTLETEKSVAATIGLVVQLRGEGVEFAGVYPNLETVLPGTMLAKSLAKTGLELDFYQPPIQVEAPSFEEAGVGFNILSLRESEPVWLASLEGRYSSVVARSEPHGSM